MKRLRIGITKLEGGYYPHYADWLKHTKPDLEFSELIHVPDVAAALAGCDALLLPGGEDVDPTIYGKTDEHKTCTIERQRDTLEFSLIKHAIQARMPILGICRGLQIVNVALGGSLIVDMPTEGIHGHQGTGGNTAERRHPKDVDQEVTVQPWTGLAEKLPSRTGTVTSNHHQGVDLVAPRLRVCAIAPDGSTEALEWAEPEGKPYLLLVHWHPERMEYESPFSRVIAKDFVAAVHAGMC